MTVCALALMRREFLVVELVFLQKIEDLKCARSTVTEFLLAVPVLVIPVLCDLKKKTQTHAAQFTKQAKGR